MDWLAAPAAFAPTAPKFRVDANCEVLTYGREGAPSATFWIHCTNQRSAKREGTSDMGKIIGIDLGTTNSVVAIMEGKEPKVIANEEGGRLTPSVVPWDDKGEVLVGQIARRQAITNPENTVYSIKRFMGRRFDEVGEEMKRIPYKIVRGTTGEVAVEI